MKKTILFFLILFSVGSHYGQGSTSSNLGFNQILNYSYFKSQPNTSEWNYVGAITVPNDKILKITSGSVYRESNGSTYATGGGIKVGSNVILSTSGELLCPVWLNSNATFNVYLLHNNSASELYGSLSIVEFNLE